jgi:hypothetical protein
MSTVFERRRAGNLSVLGKAWRGCSAGDGVWIGCAVAGLGKVGEGSEARLPFWGSSKA